MNVRRTSALVSALALMVYGSAPSAQTAPSTAAPSPPAPQAAAPAAAAASHDDVALTKAVHSALDADPNYYYRHVNVRVVDGVAELSGYVDSRAAISRARKVAGKVPGITRVVTNHLQIDTQLRR